jgi:erythromycin esterase-like protein
MADPIDRSVIASIHAAAHRLEGSPADFDPLLDRIGDAAVVLIGEASHGTHEFYRIRAEITKRLIRDKGFSGVAVEADWPDAYRVNRYVRGRVGDADSAEALAGFIRFPQWMWRNADVLDFVGWLRAFNDERRGESEKVGFYGLDLYTCTPRSARCSTTCASPIRKRRGVPSSATPVSTISATIPRPTGTPRRSAWRRPASAR